MTGQVKEEILIRWGELGIEVENGCLRFAPRLLHQSEFFTKPHSFSYVDLQGTERVWEMPAGTLGFTYCQVPFCYQLADRPGVCLQRYDGTLKDVPSPAIDRSDSNSIFARDGAFSRVTVFVPRGDIPSDRKRNGSRL